MSPYCIMRTFTVTLVKVLYCDLEFDRVIVSVNTACRHLKYVHFFPSPVAEQHHLYGTVKANIRAHGLMYVVPAIVLHDQYRIHVISLSDPIWDIGIGLAFLLSFHRYQMLLLTPSMENSNVHSIFRIPQYAGI